jgi:hypothetical protein
MGITTEEWEQVRAELTTGSGLGMYDVVDALVVRREEALDKRFVERVAGRVTAADYEDDGVEYWDAGPWVVRRDATSATGPATYEVAGTGCSEADLRLLATAAWSAVGEPPAATMSELVDLVLARLADAVGEMEEFSKDLTWETGEVLVPRGAVVDLVRAFRHPLASASPDGSGSQLGEPACRVCGCTESDACYPTCSWREPDLCSKCADMAAAKGADVKTSLAEPFARGTGQGAGQAKPQGPGAAEPSPHDTLVALVVGGIKDILRGGSSR